jgi:hypothetical protein
MTTTIERSQVSSLAVDGAGRQRQDPTPEQQTAEHRRLLEARARTAHWRQWGPYLSERQWATVREDYSPYGTAWEYFPHDHARSRAYRWGEDGLAGISDNHQRLCFALALWNHRDPILKERLFGLTGNEGNHGEDVKEVYFYLDSTPTHSYMKFLYKYPQAEFPYGRLVEENRRRGRGAPELELADTGVFDGGRYFDLTAEYAKGSPDDVLVRITATNRGPEPAPLELLPTLWFRNTWSWEPGAPRPRLAAAPAAGGWAVVEAEHPTLGRRLLACEGSPELLFTENETNTARLWGVPNRTPYVKDGVDEAVVHGRSDAVNRAGEGTKVAARYSLVLGPGESATVRLRLAEAIPARGAFGEPFDDVVAARVREADEFYATVVPAGLSDDARNVMRQALAGMLWSKQFYHYDVRRWLDGDPAQPAPPGERRRGRNREWTHLYNDDVLSMPDKWEYPWFAAWDLAFHAIPLAIVDPDFAKHQLLLMLREWYMHPNGQIPAYEWAFGDVNPPVHAWAAWRVYKIDAKRSGRPDRAFLERVFQKLLLNFTWWVNRKDAEGNNVFQGGFLGLDNIGVFDRSAPLPGGGHLEQSDGTAWMATYCLNMLAMALELAEHNKAYEDLASKFFEHFVRIAHAMDDRGGLGTSLWSERDGFYYDVLHPTTGRPFKLRVRSMVGLIPLYATYTLEPDVLERLPGFAKRLRWFVENRPDFREHCMAVPGADGRPRHFLTIVPPERLVRVLRIMLDESEFLSPYGIRAVSRVHRDRPYVLSVDGMTHRVGYEPAESSTGLFGGNSNWRGPIWFPVNYLLVEALQKFDHFFGEGLRVPCPSNGGPLMTLREVSAELSRRLARIFLRDAAGRRPVHGAASAYVEDPQWRDLVLFYEYFDGDNGRGVGASHQTGWTGLVAKLLQQSGA